MKCRVAPHLFQKPVLRRFDQLWSGRHEPRGRRKERLPRQFHNIHIGGGAVHVHYAENLSVQKKSMKSRVR